MTKRHVSLYDNNDNPAPVSVVRQELVTIEQTEQGLELPALRSVLSRKKFWRVLRVNQSSYPLLCRFSRPRKKPVK